MGSSGVLFNQLKVLALLSTGSSLSHSAYDSVKLLNWLVQCRVPRVSNWVSSGSGSFLLIGRSQCDRVRGACFAYGEADQDCRFKVCSLQDDLLSCFPCLPLTLLSRIAYEKSCSFSFMWLGSIWSWPWLDLLSLGWDLARWNGLSPGV